MGMTDIKARHSEGSLSRQNPAIKGRYGNFDRSTEEVYVYRSGSGGVGMQWRVDHGWHGSTAHQVHIPRDQMADLACLASLGLNGEEAMRVIRELSTRLGKRRLEAIERLVIGLDIGEVVEALIKKAVDNGWRKGWDAARKDSEEQVS